jgi:hypothetical protein
MPTTEMPAAMKIGCCTRGANYQTSGMNQRLVADILASLFRFSELPIHQVKEGSHSEQKNERNH